MQEARLVVNLLAALSHLKVEQQTGPPIRFTGTCGIITPYREQVNCISYHLKEYNKVHGNFCFQCDINTVDAFQGQERDIIIGESCCLMGSALTIRRTVSVVRAKEERSTSSGVGFLQDYRRMNVALTRAKYACWVIGHAKTLQQSEHWMRFQLYTRNRGCLIELRDPGIDLFKL